MHKHVKCHIINKVKILILNSVSKAYLMFQEIVPVQDLLKYTKNQFMSTSLIQLQHMENVDIACNIFRVS